MKNLYPFSIALVLCLHARAQTPQFTYADFAPQAGDQYTVNNASYYTPGNAGANQTWNMSLAIFNGTATYSVTPVSAIPCGSQYPTCNLGIGLGGYEMFQRDWNILNCVGNTITPGQANFVYSDPEKRFAYPMNFNNTFSDVFSGVSNATQTVTRTGFTLVSCDGFGTLVTPVDTFTNAIRIHRSVSWTDSFASGTDVCSGDYYYWFVSGNRYPVVQMWSVNCTGGFSQGAMFLQSVVIGVGELTATATFNVFPNPFTTTLTFSPDAASIGMPVEMVDISGRVVMTAIATAETKLNCEGLEPGMYFMRCNRMSVRVVKGE